MTAAMAPRSSAHAHISGTAAYSSAARAPNAGARMSNRIKNKATPRQPNLCLTYATSGPNLRQRSDKYVPRQGSRDVQRTEQAGRRVDYIRNRVDHPHGRAHHGGMTGTVARGLPQRHRAVDVGIAF